jgi:hypothetical protein
MKQAAAAPVTAKPAGAVAGSEKPAVTLQTLGALEKEMDGRLSATGASINDPCIVQGGGTRGLYVDGIGAIFTGDVDLVNTPSPGIFVIPISAEQRASVHKRKLAHVQLLQQTMRDMVLSLSASPALKLADTDQVVVAIRLAYRPWEDLTGLPGQMVMRLDRRGGAPKLEVQ